MSATDVSYCVWSAGWWVRGTQLALALRTGGWWWASRWEELEAIARLRRDQPRPPSSMIGSNRMQVAVVESNVERNQRYSLSKTAGEVGELIATLYESVFGTFLLERISFWRSGETRTASPAEWLKRFNAHKEHKVTRSARWPKTPSTLGNELRRLAPTLRDRGVAVTFGKNRNSRLITFTRENGFDSSGAAREHFGAPSTGPFA